MATRRITIETVQIGMHVVKLDLPWYRFAFLGIRSSGRTRTSRGNSPGRREVLDIDPASLDSPAPCCRRGAARTGARTARARAKNGTGVVQFLAYVVEKVKSCARAARGRMDALRSDPALDAEAGVNGSGRPAHPGSWRGSPALDPPYSAAR
ncbi:MAG: hypothetical protein U0231_11465 [Nitrospiraceae bacterium]